MAEVIFGKLGDGYSSGYSSGDGSGSGDGDGDGYGSGYGSKEYWLATISHFAKKWPDDLRAKMDAALKAGAQLAFWRSKQSGQPSNGGGEIESAAPGVIHTAPGPLNLCKAGTLHATLLPPKWNGERWWIVAMHGEIIGDEEKYGCLRREIIGECI